MLAICWQNVVTSIDRAVEQRNELRHNESKLEPAAASARLTQLQTKSYISESAMHIKFPISQKYDAFDF